MFLSGVVKRQIESLVCAIWGLCMVLERVLGGGGEKRGKGFSNVDNSVLGVDA